MYKFFAILVLGIFVTNQAKAFDEVIAKAKALSEKPYQIYSATLPESLLNLNYDEFRALRYSRDKGPWFGQKLPFEIQFFHLGSIFKKPVFINEIVGTKKERIAYSSQAFTLNNEPLFPLEDIGHAGFRLHYQLNSKKYYDELVTFLGASYFRALGQGQKYGISARGLAIDTGLISGEEFPEFVEFWVQKPKIRSKNIVAYALLDSPRMAGAYKFVITPGNTTTMEVSATLFPRSEVQKLGIAPLTSMYLFGENTKSKFFDYRPEVHDSDGLLVHNANDEWMWRPLDNSNKLRISSFIDSNNQGFGLLQRDRDAKHYQDFEAFYEDRPSVWIEPIEPFGDGSVELIEIPSDKEIHDNVVAMFVPKNKLKPNNEYTFKYKISWFKNKLPYKYNLAEVLATNVGIGGFSGVGSKTDTKFAIDFKGGSLDKLGIDNISPVVEAQNANIKNVVVIKNPLTKGYRLFFDFEPKHNVSEIRAILKSKVDDKVVSELWSYQWLD